MNFKTHQCFDSKYTDEKPSQPTPSQLESGSPHVDLQTIKAGLAEVRRHQLDLSTAVWRLEDYLKRVSEATPEDSYPKPSSSKLFLSKCEPSAKECKYDKCCRKLRLSFLITGCECDCHKKPFDSHLLWATNVVWLIVNFCSLGAFELAYGLSQCSMSGASFWCAFAAHIFVLSVARYQYHGEAHNQPEGWIKAMSALVMLLNLGCSALVITMFKRLAEICPGVFQRS